MRRPTRPDLLRRLLAGVAVAGVAAVSVTGCTVELGTEPDDPAGEDPTIPLPTSPIECATDLEPAPVPVLPRTSNDEVRQLVSDLLGAPVDPALFVRWTPLAQVRGFDTLTESRIDPQTLEEQLRTTEAVAAALVQSPSVMASCPTVEAQAPVCALHGSYDATGQFSGEQGRDCWSYIDANGRALTFNAGDQRWTSPLDAGLFIWNTGLHPGIAVDVKRRWTAPVDGTATLRGVVGDADGGGGDGIVVVISGPAGTLYRTVIVNGAGGETFDVPVQVRRGDVIDILVQRGAGGNAYDSTALTASVDFTVVPSTAGLTWENCGRPVVEQIASRAWRRPVRPDELNDLRTVFDETSTSATSAGLAGAFHEGLQATLQASLLSPSVHYKPELVPGGFAAAEAHFKIASRLAFFFRGSFPDAELWAAAAASQLGTDDAIRAQAERLLAQDGDRFVQNFAGQWLDFRAPVGGAPTALQQSMRQEAHDVFATILAEEETPERLIAPGFTIVDAALASHYGLPANPGEGPVRVTTSERGGLFTQGHFLTSTATGSDFKRVIHRGIWTLNRTLCRSMPMLDAATREEINGSVGQIDPAMPLGDRMEIHRNSSGRCNACHAQMDPLGLALEKFDENGLWRDTYEDGSAIDNDFDFDGISMRNPSELAAFVGESGEFRHCVAERLLTFGLYRTPRDEELCVIDEVGGVDVDDTGLATTDDTRSLHDIAIDAFLASLRLTEER